MSTSGSYALLVLATVLSFLLTPEQLIAIGSVFAFLTQIHQDRTQRQ